MIAERRIDYIKVGGRVRFDSADVDRFIDNGRRPASA
ncbi:MAG: helix-turn-helix domain-containing protein [Actinobacteria bacterium]|nr:helix-turn-helix domain-containing protein [Actinomycetota bacterium]